MTRAPDADPAGAPVAPAGSRVSGRHRAILLLGALVLSLLVRGLLVESWFVPEGAADPALAAGDRVLVLKTARSPARGDLVVADVTDGLPGQPSRATHVDDGPIGSVLWSLADSLGIRNDFRSIAGVVTGLPGDAITCCHGDRVHVNGSPGGPAGDTPPVDLVVPQGHLWLRASARSTVVPADAIVGEVLWRFWPLTSLGPLPGDGS